MMQQTRWRLIGAAAALLAGAAVANAAVQGRERVYWLGIENWELREHEGGVYLVESRWDKADGPPLNKPPRWHVSAPTIKSESGKFLASDPKGPDLAVRLAADKGAHAEWTFEFITQLRPMSSREGKGMKEGGKGFTFRARMAGGPFRGWYLAAGENATGQGEVPARRRLRLVPNVKDATAFTYLEEHYWVDHK